MPLSLIFFTVSTLMVTGIISLTDAFIRFILYPKSAPKSVILYIQDSTEPLDCSVRKLIKKYPYSKLSVRIPSSNKDAEKITELLKRDYPYLSVQSNI